MRALLYGRASHDPHNVEHLVTDISPGTAATPHGVATLAKTAPAMAQSLEAAVAARIATLLGRFPGLVISPTRQRVAEPAAAHRPRGRAAGRRDEGAPEQQFHRRQGLGRRGGRRRLLAERLAPAGRHRRWRGRRPAPSRSPGRGRGADRRRDRGQGHGRRRPGGCIRQRFDGAACTAPPSSSCPRPRW